MDTQRLDDLVAEREKLQDRLDDIDSEIFQAAAPCPHCRNHHYPHCYNPIGYIIQN